MGSAVTDQPEQIKQTDQPGQPGQFGQTQDGEADLLETRLRLRRRERELAAIRRVTAVMHRRTSLDELERMALEVAIETVDAVGGTIYIHDPKKSVLIFRYVFGATPEITKMLQGREMADTQGVAGEVF